MCTSGCLTQDHASYGDCLRAKSVSVVDPQGRVHRTAIDKELDSYAAAKRQGVQPATTQQRDIDAAMRISEATGEAYQA